MLTYQIKDVTTNNLTNILNHVLVIFLRIICKV